MFGAGQHATVSMTSRQVLNRVLFLETTCGGLARVQLCWILAKYAPLHHTSCSQIVHVRILHFRLGGVSFLWHQLICLLVHCEIWFPLFIDTWMNFSIIFFENLNGFLNAYSRSSSFSSWVSLLLSHSCLKCVVFFQIFSTCHLSNQERSCLKCGTLTSPHPTPTPAWRSINNECKSHGTLTSSPTPTPAWRSINNESKSHGTLTSPPTPALCSINNECKSHGTLTSPPTPPQPLRGVASTTWASHMERNIPPQPLRGVASTTSASHMER